MKKTCENIGSDGKKHGGLGNAEVIEALAESYHGDGRKKARNFAIKLCRNEVEADELVQEAYYRALKEWRSYVGTRPMEAWIIAILRNIFIDGRRLFSWRKGVSLDALCEFGDSFANFVDDGAPGISDCLEKEEIGRILNQAMGELPSKTRRVLVFCDVEGLSYRLAAQRLGVTTTKVRSRLHRARKALRRSPSVRLLE